jgi:iron complex outermembrane receptor protein
VVNLRLREARSGGGLTLTHGRHYTTVSTARRENDEEDGATITASGWQGLPLGDDGFLTLSAEYLQRDPTNRADLDPRVTPNAVTARFGDPDVEQVSAFANAGLPLSGGWQAYGWAGVQHRDSESAAFPRLASNVNNVAAIYPNGFLPRIVVESLDASAAGGVRGAVGGWDVDLNLVYGRNALEFSTANSLNATYGAASPTDFDSGELTYDQLVFGADASRQIDLGLAGPVSLAVGLEARNEGYEIVAGQPESYDRGPLGGNTALAGGAQGFVGFQPSNEVDTDRQAVGAYIDVEAPITDRFTLAGAVRFEDYSDFGTSTTGKVSARYDFSDAFAVRGSASTGFRAPSLQQASFTSTASVVQAGVVVETGTFPATSPVAAALGAQPLQPEESVNYTVGTVFRLGALELTIDAYRIEIEDQIVLSENINRAFSPQVASLLDPLGVQAARFFLNGVDTTTEGVDVVARWRVSTEAQGDWDFTLAANVNDVEVTRVPTSSSVLNPVPPLFIRSRVETIQQGTPDTKVSANVDWTQGRWGLTGRATYYGEVVQPGTTAAADIFTGDATVVDVAARFQPNERVTLTLGLDNAFDEYPDAVPAALNSNGVIGFPFYSPFGFNGRYAYVRLGLNW